MSPHNHRLPAALTGILLAAATAPATAAEWFADGGLGLAQTDGYELETWATDLDDEDAGWRVHAGRQFSRNFALSFGYLDFGTLKATGSVPELPADFTEEIEVSAFELTALGLWPLGERIELYGTASYLYWDQTVATLVNGTPLSFDATGGSGGIGGGFRFWWRENVAITLDARRYVDVGDREKTGRENRRDLFTAGVTVRFGE